jgi:hypothetical protein
MRRQLARATALATMANVRCGLLIVLPKTLFFVFARILIARFEMICINNTR